MNTGCGTAARRHGDAASFAALEAGQSARITKTIAESDVEAFARLSGDYNPLHMDSDFARGTSFQRRVVHGMLVAGYVSTLVGMHLPGPGALWTEQNFRWKAPVFIGDTLEIALTITHKSEGSRTITVGVEAKNQDGNIVMEGNGTVKLLEKQARREETPLSERVAIVSGGARGIGAAIARALGNAGAAVVVNYRNSESQANEICEEIRSNGGRAFPCRADVTDAGAVTAMAECARGEFGKPVDVLINNAARAAAPRPFLEMSWEEAAAAFDVQVRGAFNCSKAVLPGMLAQKSGCIVNIGSMLTWNVPTVGWTALAMAKSSLKALTRSLAAEFGPQGIRVNLVSPGMTETDSIAGISERLRKLQAMQTPLRRLSTPEDVAKTVLFLCSGAGDFITGADIPVCGGLCM